MPNASRNRSHDNAPDLSKAYIRLRGKTVKAIQNEQKLRADNRRYRDLFEEASQNADSRAARRIQNILTSVDANAQERANELRKLQIIFDAAPEAGDAAKNLSLAVDTLLRIALAAENDVTEQENAVGLIMDLCAESERENARRAFRSLDRPLRITDSVDAAASGESGDDVVCLYGLPENNELELASDEELANPEPTSCCAALEFIDLENANPAADFSCESAASQANDDVAAAVARIDALFDRLENATTSQRMTLSDLFRKRTGWFRSAVSKVGLVWRYLKSVGKR